MLPVGDFINAFSAFIVFNSFSDDGNHVELFLHTVDVEFGICPVAAIDADSLQSEQLFKYIPALAEVHDTVKLYVVASPVEDAILDDKLLGGNNEPELGQIQTAVKYHKGCNGAEYQERCLEGDGLVTGNEEQYHTDKEHQSLTDDKLRPMWTERDDVEASDYLFHNYR